MWYSVNSSVNLWGDTRIDTLYAWNLLASKVHVSPAQTPTVNWTCDWITEETDLSRDAWDILDEIYHFSCILNSLSSAFERQLAIELMRIIMRCSATTATTTLVLVVPLILTLPLPVGVGPVPNQCHRGDSWESQTQHALSQRVNSPQSMRWLVKLLGSRTWRWWLAVNLSKRVPCTNWKHIYACLWQSLTICHIACHCMRHNWHCTTCTPCILRKSDWTVTAYGDRLFKQLFWKLTAIRIRIVTDMVESLLMRDSENWATQVSNRIVLVQAQQSSEWFSQQCSPETCW